MMDWGYNHMGWFEPGFGLFSALLPLLFWGFLIYLLISIFRHPRHSNQFHADTSLEILKQRYAKGEITKKEFEDMKKDLA